MVLRVAKSRLLFGGGRRTGPSGGASTRHRLLSCCYLRQPDRTAQSLIVPSLWSSTYNLTYFHLLISPSHSPSFSLTSPLLTSPQNDRAHPAHHSLRRLPRSRCPYQNHSLPRPHHPAYGHQRQRDRFVLARSPIQRQRDRRRIHHAHQASGDDQSSHVQGGFGSLLLRRAYHHRSG